MAAEPHAVRRVSSPDRLMLKSVGAESVMDKYNLGTELAVCVSIIQSLRSDNSIGNIALLSYRMYYSS